MSADEIEFVPISSFEVPKSEITFYLDGFTKYVFTFGGEKIELTPEEVYHALTQKQS